MVKMDSTLQLRHSRTTHARIIGAYFAYTCKSIHAHRRVNTRVCLFVMHSPKFLCIYGVLPD